MKSSKRKVLKVDDFIFHSLCLTIPTKITDIEEVEAGEKYGEEVAEANLEAMYDGTKFYIFTCEDGHWIQSEQVDIEETRKALWLQHEADINDLITNIGDVMYHTIIKDRLEIEAYSNNNKQCEDFLNKLEDEQYPILTRKMNNG